MNTARQDPVSSPEALVTDPVCGMRIAEAKVAAAMSMSSVSVVTNVLRLRAAQI